MVLEEYNMCKKCSYGCCKEIVKYTLEELWKEICECKRVDIEMFGSSAHISFADLEYFFGRKEIEESSSNDMLKLLTIVLIAILINVCISD